MASDAHAHHALVTWPSAPFTQKLVSTTLSRLDISIEDQIPEEYPGKLVQWSTYDSINHELAFSSPDRVLTSSYVIRKALIRKHFLSRSIRSYVTKRPDSILVQSSPRTWEVEISYADELEEMWTDDLYDLGEELDSASERWYILKPGMADRGMGIRLFSSKDELQAIFEEFEGDTDEEDAEHGLENVQSSTAVVMSQLRHFVIQEYLSNPLLADPAQAIALANSSPVPDKLQGHKFHLRAYCVAVGDLKLYLWTDILALFSSTPYSVPVQEGGIDDLAAHLTNTSLQIERGEENVRLLSELTGCQVLSGQSQRTLTPEDIAKIVDQVGLVLAETFRAALEMPVHFQPLPNAFELFGVDFLVTHDPADEYRVHLLEVNAEPAIELTGPRLSWVLEDLFRSIGEVGVRPFLTKEGQKGEAGAILDCRMRECLETQVRG